MTEIKELGVLKKNIFVVVSSQRASGREKTLNCIFSLWRCVTSGINQENHFSSFFDSQSQLRVFFEEEQSNEEEEEKK